MIWNHEQNKESVLFYTENYEAKIFDFVQQSTQYVKDPIENICRFCGNKGTFKKKAHAIPEAIGNKSIVQKNECDECNSTVFSPRWTDICPPWRKYGTIALITFIFLYYRLISNSFRDSMSLFFKSSFITTEATYIFNRIFYILSWLLYKIENFCLVIFCVKQYRFFILFMIPDHRKTPFQEINVVFIILIYHEK